MTGEKKARRNCPVCGARNGMVFKARDAQVEYKGHTREHIVNVWSCDVCDDFILEGDALTENERVFIELRAEVEQVLLPEHVKEIREKLGISQREAGRVLGGGVRAFQKYESGEVPVSDAMKNLLVLLGNDPRRLRELRLKQTMLTRQAREERAQQVLEQQSRRAGKRSNASKSGGSSKAASKPRNGVAKGI